MFMLKKFTHTVSTGITLSIALIGTTVATPAIADSFFGASAVADLMLIDIGSSGSLNGLDVRGFDDSFSSADPGADAEGTVDFYDNPLGLGLGFDMSVAAFADGEATPSFKSLEADAESFGSVEIFNGTGSEVEISFSLDYSLDTLAELVEPAGVFDDAAVDAFVDIVINQPGGSETITESLFADLLHGPTGDFIDGFSDFTLTLGPGEECFVDVTTGVFGFADTTPVPLPAALPLFASALLGFAGVGYNRRRTNR